jgi:hypothetical protein
MRPKGKPKKRSPTQRGKGGSPNQYSAFLVNVVGLRVAPSMGCTLKPYAPYITFIPYRWGELFFIWLFWVCPFRFLDWRGEGGETNFARVSGETNPMTW